jgi:hypothetical protein
LSKIRMNGRRSVKKMVYVRVHPCSIAAEHEALLDMSSRRRHGVPVLMGEVLASRGWLPVQIGKVGCLIRESVPKV